MKLLQSKFSYYICCCTDNDHSFLTHAKPDNKIDNKSKTNAQ